MTGCLASPGAKIRAVEVFSELKKSEQGTTISIIKDIQWAVSHDACVIDMSFAGARDPALDRALKAAHRKGVVLVAAAGNAGPKSPPLYPGANPDVIAVTATDFRNELFGGANSGAQLSVAAPGVDILAPRTQESYELSTGTSIAAAPVSGITALMLQLDPTLKSDDVCRILESTAADLGPKGEDKQSGWSLVNAQKALAVVVTLYKTSDASSKNHWVSVACAAELAHPTCHGGSGGIGNAGLRRSAPSLP